MPYRLVRPHHRVFHRRHHLGWILALGWLVTACAPITPTTYAGPNDRQAQPETPPVPLVTGHPGAVTPSMVKTALPGGEAVFDLTPTRAASPTVTSPSPTITPPKPTPTAPVDACRGGPGQVVSSEIETPHLNHLLAFRVYLPPCYGVDPARRYPVLYLLHGQTFTDDQWDRLGADEAAGSLISSGELPPFLIVMPYDSGWRRPQADGFDEALVEDLLPWIDARYLTRPEREYRAIGGLSRGAAWAVHLGLTRWDLFGAVGAHSLALFWEDVPYLSTWIQAIPTGSLPRFFLDAGRKDPDLVSIQEFEQLLSEQNVPHEWRLFTGYHDEPYWSAHVEAYVRFYGEGWGDRN